MESTNCRTFTIACRHFAVSYSCLDLTQQDILHYELERPPIMLPMTTDQSEKADSGSVIETHEHIQPYSEYSIVSMKIQTQCPSEAYMRRSACCVHPDHQMTQKSFLRSPLTSDVVIEGTHRISVRPVTACRTSSSKGQAPPLPGFGPCSDLPSTSDLIFLTFCSRPSMGPTGFLPPRFPQDDNCCKNSTKLGIDEVKGARRQGAALNRPCFSNRTTAP